jgi:hypothetical protein
MWGKPGACPTKFVAGRGHFYGQEYIEPHYRRSPGRLTQTFTVTTGELSNRT